MNDDRPLSETLENRLMGQGIYLESWDRTPGSREDGAGATPVVSLEYETVATAPSVTSDEVGTVVRILLAAVEERDGWETATLEATSYATDGTVRGCWRVEREWFRRLHDDLTEVEFSQRVLETIRTDRPEEQA